MPLEVVEPSADFSSSAVVAFIREELADLRRAGQLGPMDVRWAVEQLIESGVGLPQVLGVVFDFAELEWLDEFETEVSSGFDPTLLAELARQLGLDPDTGKPTAAALGRKLSESLPPTSAVQRRDASAMGCEGARQRPLRGWQR